MLHREHAVGESIMNRISNGERRPIDAGSRHFASPTVVKPKLRNKVMKKLLIDLRDQELRKIRALVLDETAIATQAPGDELDQARRDGDLEFQVSLLDLSQGRLAAITATLARLDEGRFGICEECNAQISLTRLKSVPFARYCFDCQKAIETALRRTRSRIPPSAAPTNLFDAYPLEYKQIAQAMDSEEGGDVPSLRRPPRFNEQ
jgi:DnaK suppressor protein